MSIKTDGICQIALVVRDIEAMVRNYEKMFGLKGLKIENLPKPDKIPAYYRGKPGDFSGCKICSFKLGPVVLELVQPDDKPSPWRDFLDKHGQGVQHIGFMTGDKYTALEELEKVGCKPFHVGYYPDLTYIFVDAAEQFGVDFNIKQGNESNREKISRMLAMPDKPIDSI
ncbi:MAG: lactoylglutathione lyase [Clostridiaceae bacterium]|jgi:methylmalonyl-CoA/ethylmalonyl-CoA epimerase|nr:lactoylglutathione lyase [Clostridiaceae bacterium]